jgi:peptidoglycan/LPS O-acetylase OafA/YrhL
MTEPSTQPGPRQHLPELDGFRALSILAVLAAHMLPLGPSEWQLNTTSGVMGMSIFFCLSGFLITQFLWVRPDIPAFLIRRVGRIVPLILLASAVFCLIVEYRPESFWAINLYYFNYDDTAIFEGLSPLWSVAVEMHFYFAIALAILLLGRKGFILIPIAAVLVTGMRVSEEVFVSIRTHLRVDEILSGSLLALVWLNRDAHAMANRVAIILGKSFYPALILWALSCSPFFDTLAYLRPYLAAALIGTILFSQGTIWHRFLSTRTMAYLAAISFALYVWHSPFRVGWFAGEDTFDRYVIKRPIGFAATFLLAHLSTFYFERYFNDLARKFTAVQRPTQQA